MIAVCDHSAMMIDTLSPQAHDADEAMHPAVLRAERRLRLLEEIADIGMELIRALRPSAEADETSASDGVPAKRRDPVHQYASLSRSLRLTFALEARTDEALAELKADLSHTRQRERRVAAWSATAASDERCANRRDQVRRSLREAAESEAESPEQLDDFLLAIEQRLAEDPAYADLEARPLREIVERLCHDIHLYPNWTRWTGAGWSDQGCVPSSINGRPRYSRFGHSSPRPIWGDDDPHELE
jgi:hypothetical protein